MSIALPHDELAATGPDADQVIVAVALIVLGAAARLSARRGGDR